LRPLGIRVNPEPSETAARETIVLDEVITFGRPRDEIYRFWREPETLPRVAPRVLGVTVLDEGVSVGASNGPGAPHRMGVGAHLRRARPGDRVAHAMKAC
jgi:uncharacterized membrane protein